MNYRMFQLPYPVPCAPEDMPLARQKRYQQLITDFVHAREQLLTFYKVEKQLEGSSVDLDGETWLPVMGDLL